MKLLLHIAPGLALPVEAATQTFGILGKRGGGKTYTAKVMAEEMIQAGVHVCAVDPIGNWWGLRVAADGKSPGLPITVLGGDYGDVPLEASQAAGEFVARLIIEEKISVVIDLSRFRKGEQTNFMIGWAETLYRLNREALHVFIDEADAWAPQRPLGNLAPRLLGAMEDLVRRGRARGLGMTMITQRSASINKDLLTQIEILIAKRTIAPQDRNAIEAWVEVHGTPAEQKTLMASLPSLPVADAWFWSPAWLNLFQCVSVRKLETFDSSATPEVGKRQITPRKLADVDLETLRVRMADTIEKAKSTDPRELQKKIAELQGGIRKLETSTLPTDPKRIEEAEKRAYACGYQEARNQDARVLRDLTATIGEQVKGSHAKIMDLFSEAHQKLSEGGYAKVYAAAPATVLGRVLDEQPRPIPKVQPSSNGHVKIASGARRMLIALAQHQKGLTDGQLGLRAQVSVKGGSFDTYLSALRTGGYIDGARACIVITQAGLSYLGEYTPLPTGRALLDYYLSQLGNAGPSRMLKALVGCYPKTLDASELGERANVSVEGGSFDTYLSKLRTLELIAGPRGALRASEEFFT